MQGCTNFSDQRAKFSFDIASRARSQISCDSAKKTTQVIKNICCTFVHLVLTLLVSWVSLNALNNFLNIWFEFCSRQSQNRREIIISQLRSNLTDNNQSNSISTESCSCSLQKMFVHTNTCCQILTRPCKPSLWHFHMYSSWDFRKK